MSLNHAVLYVGDLSKQQSFYASVLGMQATDTVPRLMTFLRRNPNHHSFGFIALPRRGPKHDAFDPSRAELSDLLIHMGDAGIKRVDGPGRHGPGQMLFTHFEDVEKNLLEWNTEIQQIDEATRLPKAWDPEPALNLWQAPGHMGPPRGFRWVLRALPVISKLSRYASRLRLSVRRGRRREACSITGSWASPDRHKQRLQKLLF
jgi:2,3-dihydroxy-p-cumate/2,3-dihydroxybenzoate 3,4-dioxygenase